MPSELKEMAFKLAIHQTTTKEELQTFARSLGVYQACLDKWRLFQVTSNEMNLKERSEAIKLSKEEFENIRGEYANGYALGR